ncbi:hypothetical protein M8J77_025115 [Diaphorina citri]|nr:hypothetical protein M8J77_025115 [Diaphorina citri]
MPHWMAFPEPQVVDSTDTAEVVSSTGGTPLVQPWWPHGFSGLGAPFYPDIFNNLKLNEKKTLEDVLKAFDEYSDPVKHECMETFTFNKLEQVEGQDFKNFLNQNPCEATIGAIKTKLRIRILFDGTATHTNPGTKSFLFVLRNARNESIRFAPNELLGSIA